MATAKGDRRCHKNQLDKIAHTTLLGPSNIPAIELAKKLVEIAPKGLKKVFYSDNGSTANEVALKMAFQYWQHKGFKDKTEFVALQYGYHGDTIGTMSVGGTEIFHSAFRPLLFQDTLRTRTVLLSLSTWKTPHRLLFVVS